MNITIDLQSTILLGNHLIVGKKKKINYQNDERKLDGKILWQLFFVVLNCRDLLFCTVGYPRTKG